MLRFDHTLKLAEDEEGIATVWMVMWMIMFMIIGGVAIDSSNAWRMRAVLQATADAAAHAAVIDLPAQEDARATALAFAERNMAASHHGAVLVDADIQFGKWDDGFTPGTGSTVDAIRVVTRRDSTSGNALSTSFLKLIGVDSFDVKAEAVAQRYIPKCMQGDGLFARKTVNLQSNNNFYNGICIHGNYNVVVNNNNTWESELTVSMPNLDDLQIPSSSIESSNPGLKDVLKEEFLDPKIVNHVDEIIAGFLDRTSPYFPAWVNADKPVIELAKNEFDSSSLETGRIYSVHCDNQQQLNIGLNLGNGNTIRKVVIVTNCRIQTGQGTALEDVIVATTASDGSGPNDYAIKIAESTRFGADDNCTKGGGAVVFSNGSINGSSSSLYYGVQMVAKKTIVAAAQAQGMEGIQFFAGEDISLTSNNAFGGECVGGVDAIIPPHFRLVL